MPYPAPYFTASTPLAPKLMDLVLYADDGSVTGTVGVPTGILFAAHRPLLLEAVAAFPGNVSGSGTTRLDAPESGANTYWNLADTSVIIGGLGADEPGQKAQYHFQPQAPGSSGDGTATPGGWHLVSHFVPLSFTSTSVACGTAFEAGGTLLNTGCQQKASTGRDNCPFYLDLQLLSSGTPYNPAVFNWDTGGGDGLNVPGPGTGTDAFSGETPRLWAVWAGAANDTWDAPTDTPPLPAPYTSWGTATTVGSTAADTVNVNGSTGICDVVNYLAFPPMWRNHVASAQSIQDTTNTKLTLASSGLDNFGGYTSSNSTWTVPRDGLYLVHGCVPWDNSNGTAQRATGISVNGTIYWGPGYPAASLPLISSAAALVSVATTKTQVFSLLAGDTVQLYARQNSGTAIPLASAADTRIFAVWLGAPGVPSTLWQPPDTSFRWQAGTTSAQSPALLQTHLANDLGFLVNRPYLLAYQEPGHTETNLSQNDWHRVNMTSVTGIVHGDAADNYGGWDPVNYQYTAQRDGWYLCVAEYFTTFPTSPPSSLVAGFSVPSSGGFSPVRTPDWYQHLLMPSANFTPGTTAAGLYYLLAGETVAPQAMVQDNGGSWGTAAGTVNGGQVNSHLEIVWLCE